MEFGPYEDALIKDVLRGGKTPQALLDKPELPPELGIAWRMFLELNNSRQYGMTINPIMISDILAWLQLNSIAKSLYSELFEIIQAMDREYVSLAVREQKARSRRGREK